MRSLAFSEVWNSDSFSFEAVSDSEMVAALWKKRRMMNILYHWRTDLDFQEESGSLKSALIKGWPGEKALRSGSKYLL